MVVIVVIAIVVFLLVRRHRLGKSSVPHQRFSDEVMVGVSPDGSIAMQNRMFDAADPGGSDPMAATAGADPTKYMSGGAEISMGGERAAYNSRLYQNGDLDNGFANPLYSVMQPSDTSQLQPPPQENGHSSGGGGGGGGESNGVNKGSVA